MSRPEFDPDDDLHALAHDIATVDDLAPFGPAHQRRRLRNVQAVAGAALEALQDGLAGERPLVEAMLRAQELLRAAEREILRAAIDETVA